MCYSQKKCSWQHWTLQTMGSWTISFIETLSRNPNRLKSSLPGMELPNHNRRIHCTMIHLQIIQHTAGVTRISWPWHVTWRCIEADGQRRSPKLCWEGHVGTVCTISFWRWGIRGYDSYLSWSCNLWWSWGWHGLSKVLQSSNWFSDHWELRYRNERWFTHNWLGWRLWRYGGASENEKGFAKSLGIQDQAWWSR